MARKNRALIILQKLEKLHAKTTALYNSLSIYHQLDENYYDANYFADKAEVAYKLMIDCEDEIDMLSKKENTNA